jgi:hypothetical protein
MCERVIRDILIPNCVWVNGRVPAAIRTAAITCAWALFQSDLIQEADLKVRVVQCRHVVRLGVSCCGGT